VMCNFSRFVIQKLITMKNWPQYSYNERVLRYNNRIVIGSKRNLRDKHMILMWERIIHIQ
jgi:hypothetical protein